MKPFASSAVQPCCISPYSPSLDLVKSSGESTPTVWKLNGRQALHARLLAAEAENEDLRARLAKIEAKIEANTEARSERAP